eukprot:NODE_103_length_1532_cov_249.159811_g76_i0.p1 GENE.NODE_103_length_1532_cov_249.159811_g76_i0~~NODE_103_length_1532_cov_249.159811_g76_i0.p1  ORF type:complete len:410 (-),score=102.66 NODE_103_length_1532_cov_249.159811_g76_i0:248-1477(-)
MAMVGGPTGYPPPQDMAVIPHTQSPIFDSMAAFEDHRRIEADYEWFRYSKFALPFLIFNLLVAVALLSLTFWQGNMTLKNIRPGIPRGFEVPLRADDNEAGIPKYNRNTRIAAIVFGFFGLLGVALTMYLKPKPKLRKLMYVFFAIIGLFVSGVIAAVAFGLDAGNVLDATRCREREQGTVLTVDPCEMYSKIATTTAVWDLFVCFFGIVTAIVLIVAAKQSASEPERLDEYEFHEGLPKRGVTKTTKEVLVILLILFFISLVLLTVFTILLHEARDQMFADEVYKVRSYWNPKPGWPVKNTRLRLGTAGAAVLAIVLNLIPFRSRIVAYCLAFVYFLLSVLCIMCFALDAKAIDTARELPCPDTWDCRYHPYFATTFLDILLGILLLLYVIAEFVARLAMEGSASRRY